MNKFFVWRLRRGGLLTLVFTTAALVGCASPGPDDLQADGTYCHRIGKGPRQKQTCTPQPVPSASVETEAKQFRAEAGALTVYVVRNRWNDASLVVPVVVNGGASVSTVPESFIRLRLPPGEHQLLARWDDQQTTTVVQGGVGDIRFVQLAGSGWSWGAKFTWKLLDAADGRARVMSAQLVADLDTRQS
jgi:hypothetical protein